MDKISVKNLISVEDLIFQIQVLLVEPFDPEFEKDNSLFIFVVGEGGISLAEIISQAISGFKRKNFKDVHYILVGGKLYDMFSNVYERYTKLKLKKIMDPEEFNEINKVFTSYPTILKLTEQEIENYINNSIEISVTDKEKLLKELNDIKNETDTVERSKKLSNFCEKYRFCVVYFLDEVTTAPREITPGILTSLIDDGKIIYSGIAPKYFRLILAGSYRPEIDTRHLLGVFDRMSVFYSDLTPRNFSDKSQDELTYESTE